MKEGDCTFKIIAVINGQWVRVRCNEETCCLHELVWSGIGVKAAAERVLNLPEKSVENAGVEGNCIRVENLV